MLTVYTATAPTAISHVWTGNGSGTTSTTSGTTSGIYTITVTDGNACTNSVSGTLTVNSNTISLGTDKTICSGSSTVLDAGIGGVNYLWNTAEATQTISVSSAGNYHVSAIDVNGCVGKDTITITLGAGLTVNLGSDKNICSGSSTTLDASNNGASYVWNTGATSQTITTSTAGSYDVVVTDGNGCVGRDTIAIGSNSLPTVVLGADQAICNGSSASFDAGNIGGIYLWNTGATTQTIAPLTAGSYDVIVTDVNGCVGKRYYCCFHHRITYR